MNAILPSLLLLTLGASLAFGGDWPRFLGPKHDARSAETGFPTAWPDGGPPRLWSYDKGSSHTAPSVAGDRAVLVHLRGGEETVDCLSAETGERLWRHAYAVKAGSSYGIDDAPRSSPVIDGDHVYVLGLASDLTCLRLTDGSVVWKKNLDAEYGESPFFFARGSCPLVWKDLLIVNVGSTPCVAGFDKATGELRWGAEHRWHGSYASPVPATIHGKERVLVFTGGMTDPPTGGLLVVDPIAGTVESEVPWRASGFASVNAASPVVAGNEVFISEGYELGGALVGFDREYMKPSIRWEAPRFLAQFSTPVEHEGLLFGFSGTSAAGAELVCLDLATGKEHWRHGDPVEVSSGGRKQRAYLGRGGLLLVDGKLLAFGEQGTLAWIEPRRDGFRLLGAAQLFNRPENFCLPALSDGRLFVTEHAGSASKLHCYDLAGP